MNYATVGIFYGKLFDYIRTNPTAGHGRNGYYFAVADEHNMKDVGTAIAQALYSLGKIKNLEATPFKQEELDQFFGVNILYFTCSVLLKNSVGLPTLFWLQCSRQRQSSSCYWLGTDKDDQRLLGRHQERD